MRHGKIIFILILMPVIAVAGIIYANPKRAASTLWDATHLGNIATIIPPDDPKLYLKIGNYYFGKGDYNLIKAEKNFRRALMLDPATQTAHYQLARINFLKSNFAEAIWQIDREISLNENFGKSYYVKGLIQGYMGQSDEAILNFKKFIAYDSYNWAGYNDLAWVYFKKGEFAQTKDAALKGLKRDPGNPWLNNSLGLALLNLGQKKEAKRAFETALEKLKKIAPEDWGKAYPGNNPNIYAQGLKEMRESVSYNLALTLE
ncbi:MAG: tetratricopeptide repeat protein [Patescibacteria group bacterium]